MFTTNRLIISIPGKVLAKEALRFYHNNKDLGEQWDPPLPERFLNLEYQKTVLEKDIKGFEEGFETRFWIFLKENPTEPIGYCLIQRVIRTDYQASCIIGYFLDEDFHNQGYMSEALELLLEVLFTNYKMQRICAYIKPENTPSIRLAKRLGFECEGVAKSYSYLHGEWADHLCYTMIRPLKYGFLDPGY